MSKTNPHLFVYGTLLQKSNQYGAYLQKHCTFLQQGKFNGRLYDAGEYPGAVISANISEFVFGSIYLMDDADGVLEVIDDYEGYGAQQQQPNLFIRELANIETDSGFINCWIYLYNLPVDGLKRIVSGEYSG